MEGKKFSSSQRVVIYVRDLLSRYQPDAFRYFVAAAGPENQDSDFTWAEFVRRTNDELVAGWGNLVNRTATMIAKNFGEIPGADELTDTDQALLDHVESTFDTVGDLIAPPPAEGRDRRGDARGRRGEQVRLGLRALEAQGRRPAGPARHGPARHRAVRRRPEHDPLAVPAVLGQRGRRRASAARARCSRCPSCRRSTTSTGERATRSSPVTTPAVAPLGAAGGRARHTGREAGAGVHQARPGSRRRGARPARRAMTAPMYLPRFFIRQKLTMMVNRYEIHETQPRRLARTPDGGRPAEADGLQGTGHVLQRRPAAPCRCSPSRRGR